ncbi:response regulator transcription factor [Telluribacter humicola]|uniref:response regulator transcription factor n=1 Tax=Telluribacter humicola TaxID=1720261 RepID=UPI001A963C36|nr:response regulator transcription factor [Telluribacter humicola]
MKVLIIEDNQELSRNIYQYLQGEGYICEVSYSVQEAEDKLLCFPYDCIVLDVMLPDGNGLDLLHFIKSEEIDTSVLIISARNALDDKILGLDLGADDYVTKPFHLPELYARLKAIYRRKILRGDPVIICNEISINTNTLEVSVQEHPLDLTRKEYDLLLYFITNKNRVLTRQTIAEHLWGDYTESLANFDFVYQHVKNLRKKITTAGGNDYIGTVYGLGYKFNVVSS